MRADTPSSQGRSPSASQGSWPHREVRASESTLLASWMTVLSLLLPSLCKQVDGNLFDVLCLPALEHVPKLFQASSLF